jgi:hypothetical protein
MIPQTPHAVLYSVLSLAYASLFTLTFNRAFSSIIIQEY